MEKPVVWQTHREHIAAVFVVAVIGIPIAFYVATSDDAPDDEPGACTTEATTILTATEAYYLSSQLPVDWEYVPPLDGGHLELAPQPTWVARDSTPPVANTVGCDDFDSDD